MERKTITLIVSETIGAVSGDIVEPKNPIAMMTLAHGAGAGMHHRFMENLANALGELGIGTLRFNFPYMENKKHRPDPPAIAEKTVASALTYLEQHYPSLPVFASGKSFGGRMTSQYLSKHDSTNVKGIIFYGFPLHPAGSPAIDRAAHLTNIKIPMLFLQGTKDTLAQQELIIGVCEKLPTATLEQIQGADHGFMISKKERIDILLEKSEAWIKLRL